LSRALSIYHGNSFPFYFPSFLSQYDTAIESMKGVLRRAEGLLTEDAAVNQGEVVPDGEAPDSFPAFFSHGGLRCAVSLLSMLAHCLPEQDVQWRVQRRLLGQEPLVDFGGCDVRARAIVLRGILDLLCTLRRRTMSAVDAAAGLGDVLARVAEDMAAALPVLDAVVAVRGQDVLPFFFLFCR
jgi:hypothetical protein